MDVTLCRASSSDRELVVRLLREEYAHHRYPFEPTAIDQNAACLLAREDLGAIFLVKGDDDVVGLLILTYGFDLEFGGRIAGLTDLYVRAGSRRMGIGAAAMRLAEVFCRSRGVHAIELQVERPNVAAKTFYERLGFEAHNRVPMSKRFAPVRSPEGDLSDEGGE